MENNSDIGHFTRKTIPLAKKIMTRTHQLDHFGDDSWAEVELFRWQYGTLPSSDDDRRLDVPKALEAMAQAIEDGCKDKDKALPSPFNVASVLSYCSRRLNKNTDVNHQELCINCGCNPKIGKVYDAQAKNES